MASSSTAKGSSASSSSSFDSSGIQWEYEVFLSFRGEDTRKNFTDHLYTALNNRGIYTFRDDQRLERGKEISSELLETIERSRFSIIVLSKNYASSTWCLEELVKILECMATKKQKVFPVFYHVDPSDIQKQRGDFETAFRKHEEAYKDSLDKVQGWRSALTQVGNLSGWHLQESCYEGEFIELIVDKISKSLKQTFSKAAEHLGIKYSSEEINDILESGLDDKRISSENDDGYALSDDSDNLTDLNRLVNGGANWRRVGKLSVSNKEIALGSNGTIVLEGIYEGRPVAVKRLVRSHRNVAFKEILTLMASDRHPNIVRLYGVETDRDFVYLSLERCTCSLDDLIQMNLDSSHNSSLDEGQDTKAMTERLDSVKRIMHLSLWKANGHPSPLLLKLMKDMVSGLVHLHKLEIVHQDLKPQNVLISRERPLCARLSDMGISKRLPADKSSLGHHATGSGSSGWQAPEQLLNGNQTLKLDLFSLGCVMYFCITGGRHPFGNRLERDINITKNQMKLLSVELFPEAEELISRLLNPEPQFRPSANEVLHHPLFWSSETRLSFLCDTSDRVELEYRETYSELLKALENTASVAVGTKWNKKMDPIFITNIGYYRHYRFDSVADLLRVMRNKLNQYRELPKNIQEIVGPVPEGFDGYFATRFPRLLIEVYKVVCSYCRGEECFQKYFESDIL